MAKHGNLRIGWLEGAGYTGEGKCWKSLAIIGDEPVDANDFYGGR